MNYNLSSVELPLCKSKTQFVFQSFCISIVFYSPHVSEIILALTNSIS